MWLAGKHVNASGYSERQFGHMNRPPERSGSLLLLIMTSIVTWLFPQCVAAAPLAYVGGASGVWVVDLDSRAVLDVIGTDLPDALSVSPDGDFLYVASSGAEPFHVSVVSTATRVVEGTITLSGTPRHLALSPDGRHLWIAHDRVCTAAASCVGIAGITVIDTATRGVTAELTQEDQGIVGVSGIAVAPDGKHIYVGSVSTSGVIAIDAQTYQTNAEPPSICCIEGAIAISPDGSSIYALGNEFGGFITIITDANTAAPRAQTVFVVGQNGTSIDFESDIAVSGDGRFAYLPGSICETGTNYSCVGALFFFDAAVAQVRDTLSLSQVPWKIALGVEGRFAYLTVPNDHSVTVVDLSAHAVVDRIRLNEPVYDIAIAPRGAATTPTTTPTSTTMASNQTPGAAAEGCMLDLANGNSGSVFFSISMLVAVILVVRKRRSIDAE